jgi:hypothetical protein
MSGLGVSRLRVIAHPAESTEAQKRLGATRITYYTLHFALYTSLYSILKKIPKNKIN